MIRTPKELLSEMTGHIDSKDTAPINIPKIWIYQLCEQYADQYIELGIGHPSKLQLEVVEVKKAMAIKLREKGFSFRQIQKALGYKSVRSVHMFIKSEKI